MARARPTIRKITKAYVRTYADNGQTVAYVEWIDSSNKHGRTEGSPDGVHMQQLLLRAEREGVRVRTETWGEDERAERMEPRALGFFGRRRRR